MGHWLQNFLCLILRDKRVGNATDGRTDRCQCLSWLTLIPFLYLIIVTVLTLRESQKLAVANPAAVSKRSLGATSIMNGSVGTVPDSMFPVGA